MGRSWRREGGSLAALLLAAGLCGCEAPSVGRGEVETNPVPHPQVPPEATAGAEPATEMQDASGGRAVPAVGASAEGGPSPAAAGGAPAGGERGRYLAEGVAMCIQCHTPRDERGELILERKFQGGRVPVTSPFPDQEWALEAPAIAGMLGYSRESEIRLLTLGINRHGVPPRPPMPRFRMTPEDAGAIYDYLANLPAEGRGGEQPLRPDAAGAAEGAAPPAPASPSRQRAGDPGDDD